jgi:hypothetical protein
MLSSKIAARSAEDKIRRIQDPTVVAGILTLCAFFTRRLNCVSCRTLGRTRALLALGGHLKECVDCPLSQADIMPKFE